MDKRIIFKNENGGISVVVPSPKFEGTMQELAAKTLPEGTEWRIIDMADLPISRNWRAAWTDTKEVVDIDLSLAKAAHKKLMIEKAMERVPADEFGVQDFTTVKAEIAALDFDAVTNLDELYNLWPESIATRQQPRKYIVHKTT